jgi:DNA repair protein RecO (recombination protein O)
MGLHRTQALITARRALGESDRLVEFYTRDFGKVRGVAKGVRRPRSRFGDPLEPFTLGELIFFDAGRSELVRIDRFDAVRPFVGLREPLERLGRGAWMVECVVRLSADRDAQPRLFRLLTRGLGALEVSPRSRWVSVCFAVRAVDLLGHRPRIDRCTCCGRTFPFADGVLDVTAGGLVCGRCPPSPDAIPLSASAVGALKRLRELRWEDMLRLPLTAALEGELASATEGMIARLTGQIPRSARFLAQMQRSLPRDAESLPPGGRR